MIPQNAVHHLLQMQEMVHQAVEFCENMSREQFLADKKTRQACVFNLLIMGECSARILHEQPAFATRFPHVLWRNMKGMRNHIAHGYATLDFETIWTTLDQFVPVLIEALPSVIAAAQRTEKDL